MSAESLAPERGFHCLFFLPSNRKKHKLDNGLESLLRTIRQGLTAASMSGQPPCLSPQNEASQVGSREFD